MAMVAKWKVLGATVEIYDDAILPTREERQAVVDQVYTRYVNSYRRMTEEERAAADARAAEFEEFCRQNPIEVLYSEPTFQR